MKLLTIDWLIIIGNCTTVVIAEWEARLMIVHCGMGKLANVCGMSEKLRHI